MVVDLNTINHIIDVNLQGYASRSSTADIAIGASTLGIATLIIMVIQNVFYDLLIYAPLFLINALWQIFEWFCGLSIGKLFLDNNSTNGDISFSINWNNALVRVFLMFLMIGVCVFIVTILITLLMHITKNKVSDQTLELKSSPLRVIKWLFLFPVVVLIIPFGLILLSFFVSLIATLLSSGFSTLSPNLGVSYINSYVLTSDNKMYLESLGTYLINNYGTSSDYATGFNNTDGNYIAKLLTDLTNIKNGDSYSGLSDTDKNVLNEAISCLNQLNTSDNTKAFDPSTIYQLGQNLQNINSSDTSWVNTYLQPYLNDFNSIQGVNIDVQYLVKDQTYGGGTNWDNWTKYFGDNSVFYQMYSTNTATQISSDTNITNVDNAIGLVNIPYYLGTDTTGNTTFFATIFIYQFVTGSDDLNWSSFQWYSNWGIEEFAYLFIGLIVVICAMFMIILYVLYLTKRLIELACYFVLSPIVAAMAVHDEGAKLSAWLKLVVAKLFSVLSLNLTFQVFFILYPLVETASDQGLGNMSILGISDSDIFNLFFIIAGLFGAYLATMKLSKFMGDDTSLAETFAEAAALTKATSMAVGATKMFAKGAKKLGSKATEGAMSKYRKKQHGDKYFDSKGNVARYGGKKQQENLRNERSEMFNLMKEDGSIKIGGQEFSYSKYEKDYGKEGAFEAFVNDTHVINAQRVKWETDNGMTKAGKFGGNLKGKWEKFSKQEHKNK